MTIYIRNNNIPPVFHPDLQVVDEMKVLRLVLDENLSFSDYILKLCRKETSVCFLLFRLKCLGFHQTKMLRVPSD